MPIKVKSVFATLLTKVIVVGLVNVTLTVALDWEGATPKNKFWFKVLPVKSRGVTVTTLVYGGVAPVLPAPANIFNNPTTDTDEPLGI